MKKESGKEILKDKELEERGKDYNHSTFCDLVINGLIGKSVCDYFYHFSFFFCKVIGIIILDIQIFESDLFDKKNEKLEIKL